MKALFLDHARRAVSGAEFRLLDLARVLPEYGVEPLVACDPASPLAWRLAALGVSPIPIVFPNLHANSTWRRRGQNAAGLIEAVAQLSRAIRSTRADVVHVNTLLPRLPALLAARLCRRPVIWHVRDVVIQAAWRRLYRRLSPLIDRIITVSDACQADFFGHPRMQTIYNGLDLARYRVDRSAGRRWLGMDDDAVVVGLAGLLTQWKGHETLLTAAARLAAGRSTVLRVVITGSEPEDSGARRATLERHAERLGLSACVRFTGFCDDVARLLAAFDVAVAPSLRPDPLPGSVLEAMAVGRPVVASRIGGIPEIVEDGVSGFLVEPGDADALADRLAWLVERPARRQDMGRAGQAIVESRFNLEGSVKRLLEVYAGL